MASDDMESNDQFARRMRAKRNGITIEEQKQRDFHEAMTVWPLDREPDLDDARKLVDRVYGKNDPDALRAGLAALRAEPWDENETHDHARIRLTDALVDMFPRLVETVGDYDPHAPDVKRTSGLTVNTATGSIDVASAERWALMEAAKGVGVDLVTPGGTPLTNGELKSGIVDKANELRRFGPAATPAGGTAASPVKRAEVPAGFAREPGESDDDLRARIVARLVKPRIASEPILLGRTMPDIRPKTLAELKADMDAARDLAELEAEMAAKAAPEQEDTTARPRWQHTRWALGWALFVIVAANIWHHCS